MAEKPFRPYDGIPSGALLYLHDSTRGEEELIFHMEDGKQVFVSDVYKRQDRRKRKWAKLLYLVAL